MTRTVYSLGVTYVLYNPWVCRIVQCLSSICYIVQSPIKHTYICMYSLSNDSQPLVSIPVFSYHCCTVAIGTCLGRQRVSRRRWGSTVLFTSSSLMRLMPFVGPEVLCLAALESMTQWSTSSLLRCELISNYLTRVGCS